MDMGLIKRLCAFFLVAISIALYSSATQAIFGGSGEPGGPGGPGGTVSPPFAPSSVTVPSSSTTGSYTLSWSSSTGAKYYSWREETNGAWGSTWSTVYGNSVSLSNRASGTYRYQVRACDNFASPTCGNTKTSSSVTVSLTVKPSTVTGVSVSSTTSSDGSFSVNWNASTNAPTRYEYQESVNGAWSGQWVSTAMNRSISKSSYGDGAYKYQVRACNSAGCSSSGTSPTVTVSIPVVSGPWSNTGGSALDATWNGDTAEPITSDVVGAVEGSGGVSGGSASYSIPIVIPPGRAGMQPNVSLSYSSRSGNGIAGVGWGLSAGSSIHRCSATVAQDEQFRNVFFAPSHDKLCLDGQRLVVQSTQASQYGLSGATYSLEMDGVTLITQSYSINSPSSSFTVVNKNGTTSYYGTSSNSRYKRYGTSSVSSWKLQRTEDTSGNSVHYNYYDFGNGEHLLSSINYTGTGNTQGNRSITFSYEGRTDRSQGYLAGTSSRNIRRLKSIETKYQSTVIRKYNLNYSYSAATKQSLLNSVEECAYKNGVPYCLVPSSFEWQSDVISHYQKSIGAGVKLTALADFDGDGLKEFLETTMEDVYLDDTSYAIGEKIISGKLVSFNSFGERAREVELDIDEVSDLYRSGRISLSNFMPSSNYTDVDNNGVPEALFFERDDFNEQPDSDGKVSYRLRLKEFDSSTNGFTELVYEAPFTVKMLYQFNRDITSANRTIFGQFSGYLMMDYDNDSIPDLVHVGRQGYWVPASEDLKVSLFKGSVHTETATYSVPSVPETLVTFASSGIDGYGAGAVSKHFYTFAGFNDVNGDGFADIKVNNNFCNLSDSSRTDVLIQTDDGLQSKTYTQMGIHPNNLPHETYHQWVDINSDGLADYIFVPNRKTNVAKTWHYQINKGGTFAPVVNMGSNLGLDTSKSYDATEILGKDACNNNNQQYTPKFVNFFQFTDFDNDGSLDLIAPFSEVPVSRSCVNVMEPEDLGRGPASPDQPMLLPKLLCPYEADHQEWEMYGNQRGGWDKSIYSAKAYRLKMNSSGIYSFEAIDNSEHYHRLRETTYSDFNGDGLTDIYMSVGDGTILSPSLVDSGRFWLDSLPSGISEMSYIYYSRGATSDPSKHNVSPNLLTKTIDALGRAHEWDYYPLSFDSSYGNSNTELYDVPELTSSERYIDDKYFLFRSSMFVVGLHRQSNGVDGLNQTKYAYRDAIYNNQGRGFQGFKRVIVEDETSGIRSTSKFHQKFPMSGKLESSATCLISSAHPHDDECSDLTLTTTDYTWRFYTNGTENGPNVFDVTTDFSDLVFENNNALDMRFLVTPRSQTQKHYTTISGANRPIGTSSVELYSTTTETEFDAFGNLTDKTTTYSDNGGTSVTSEQNNTYINDVGNWSFLLNKSIVTSNPVNNISSALDVKKVIETSYDYAANRKPILITTTPTIGGGCSSSVETQYNSYGLPTTVTSNGKDENCNSTSTSVRNVTTTYNGSENYFVNTITNAKGHVTTTTVDPTHGQALTITDPNGKVTSMTYDAFGRVRSSKGPGTPIQWTTYNWCSGVNSGSAWCTTNVKYRVRTEQKGAPLTYTYYDSMNRELDSLVARFDGNNWYRQYRAYDNKGRLRHETNRYDNTNIYETRRYTYYDSYDALGRLTSKRTPQADGTHMQTDYSYNGFTTDIDVFGGITLDVSRQYNGLGQLMQTTDAENGVTQYSYDGTGNPIILTDAKGNSIKAKYNALGQKEWVDDPNMGLKEFKYNTYGEVEWEKDANGDVLTYVYDVLGRMTYRKTNGVTSSRWVYDETWSRKGLGLLSWEENGNTFEGRLRKIYYYTTNSHSCSKTLDQVKYRYYGSGSSDYNDEDVLYYTDNNYCRPKGMRYNSSGLTLTYDYNDRGYMTKIKNANGGYVYQEITEMDAMGNVTEQKQVDALLTQKANFNYATGQMESIQTTRGSTEALLHDYTYYYDGFSNLIGRNVQAPLSSGASLTNQSETYEYDPLHRLTKSYRGFANNINSVIEYDYDSVGNFTKKTDFSSNYVYGTTGKNNAHKAGPNAVRSVTLTGGGTGNYYYDNNGNMVRSIISSVNRGGEAITGNEITYNEFNKPVVIENRSTNVTTDFSYGADIMRYKQVKSGLPGGKTETTYYVDKLLEKIETRNNGTNLSETVYKHYIGDVAVQTKKVTSTNSSWDIGFIQRDRLGSVVTVTNDNGVVIERRDYDPFGKPRKGNTQDQYNKLPFGATILGSQMAFDTNFGELVTDRGFTDHEHLDDFELIHMNGRAYDYNLGRFLSVDPFIQAPGNSQSMNPYSYIMNNPLSGTDPSGYLICSGNMSDCLKNIKPWDLSQEGGSGDNTPETPKKNGEGTRDYLGENLYQIFGGNIGLPSIAEQKAQRKKNQEAGESLMIEGLEAVASAPGTVDDYPDSRSIKGSSGGIVTITKISNGVSDIPISTLSSTIVGGISGAADIARASPHPVWVGTVAKGTGVLGTGFKVYSSQWGGNGTTGGKLKSISQTKNFLNNAGKALIFVGAAARIVESFENLRNAQSQDEVINELGDTGLDLAFGLVALVPGPGWLISLTYFAVDNFFLKSSGGVFKAIRSRYKARREEDSSLNPE